ncbi:hypothetical protein [Afipia clevelandensis]|uniref:Uncharacterized protein n=1 Tax=Afipia clevelandensis ATCC 49720 TaxID=883079 RepID=K8P2G0_9BRAD|nr:hypothetical protein [Afipia clevelandensis]EKS33885.1 hypothetical protein HMPREF9696_03005 [Afipia clevelandensis ATCC 49720]
MTIFQLTPQQIEQFANEPEVDMGVQVGIQGDGTPLVVESGRIAVLYDDDSAEQLNLFYELVGVGRDGAFSAEEYGQRLEAWVSRLRPCPPITPMAALAAWSILPFIHMGPRYPLPATPWRPSYVYGHLPFKGLCGGQDVFYRYEQFSKSQRIDRASNRIVKPETYAAPASEKPFTPTGLSAVGRFALPKLLPACWRYELTPVRGTLVYYGASVPLYGQSGGAVEVMFPHPFDNHGNIPAATVLPIL